MESPSQLAELPGGFWKLSLKKELIQDLLPFKTTTMVFLIS